MTSRGVRVEGLRELDRALGELPKATARNVLLRALGKAAEPMHSHAKSLAPVRDDDRDVYFGPDGARKLRRPGTTKHLVQAGTRLTPRQRSQARKEGKAFAEYYVGTRDRAARFPEFGTAEMPAQPFLRPAWDANKQRALDIFRTELGGEISKAANRLARRAARARARRG